MSAGIQIENLSKRYRLGQARSGRLGDVVQNAAGRLLGRSPAVAAYGSTAHANRLQVDDAGDFWALRDVSLEIAPGEVVGLIGRNGAGKSTLLKILSRITPPSSGRAVVGGRVASLLEVGTGFHPELTGRENISLNGSILGLTRREIADRFEAIVEFSEIADFLDTPVKRYSSGMYVRLAFAVAAHLDPEILIVDEVLAVGDVQFQAKCLRKLQEASRLARTVLFVSHNLHAISTLCDRAVLLKAGRVAATGPTAEVVSQYLSEMKAPDDAACDVAAAASGPIAFTGRSFVDRFGRASATVPFQEPLTIVLDYEIAEPIAHYRIGITVETSTGILVSTFTTEERADLELPLSRGAHRVQVSLPAALLAPGHYFITCCLDQPGYRVFDERTRWDGFSVIGNPLPRNRPWEGLISISPHWQIEERPRECLQECGS